MSVLKNIVLWVFIFQLSLLVVNNVEIIPGVKIDTGNITNNPATISFDETMNSINYLGVLFNGGGVGNNSIRLCPFSTVPIIGPIISNANFAGNTFCYTPNAENPSVVDQFMIFFTSIFNIIIGWGFVFLGLIYNSTIGAVFFYSKIFSLIDPVLGSVLGLVLGSIQALLVFLGITEIIIGLGGGGLKDE